MEKQTDLLHLQERTNHTLSREIMGFQRESEKQRRIITQLELERDRYLLENDNLSQRYMKVRPSLFTFSFCSEGRLLHFVPLQA